MNRVTVTSNTPMGTDLRWLVLDRPLDGYTQPGQFVTAHLPEHKPGYFAIASTVSEPLTLLIRPTGPTASAIAALAAGDTLEVSDPIGKGFPMNQVAGLPLVILVAGSGLSAVRPVIQAEIDASLPRSVTVFYGVFTQEHCACPDDLKAWAAAGIDVRLVLSDPPSSWGGATGFVQHAAQSAGHLVAGNGLVVCGHPAMVKEIQTLCAEVGVDSSHVLTNF
jgi:NAD(P)H-flavin reductase